jgi:CO/xanthine dehydrogenase FAD-binding subunit
MKLRLAAPRHLIDINGIACLGALTRESELEENTSNAALARQRLAREVGAPQRDIHRRARGTVPARRERP